MRVAVIGATGLAGARVVERLTAAGADVVPVSRAAGVDVLTGRGLGEAFDGVDVTIDASNVTPPDESVSRHDAVVKATRKVVEACRSHGVRRLVVLSIANIEKPDFDAFPYYVAKRAQESEVQASGLETSIVRSAQWFEFATNPAAVTFLDDCVEAKDWFIQPLAVGAVADVLVRAALGIVTHDVVVAGRDAVRLPDLVAGLLEARGDARPVRTVPAALAGFSNGALLAPAGAELLGPSVAEWLGAEAAGGR